MMTQSITDVSLALAPPLEVARAVILKEPGVPFTRSVLSAAYCVVVAAPAPAGVLSVHWIELVAVTFAAIALLMPVPLSVAVPRWIVRPQDRVFAPSLCRTWPAAVASAEGIT